jgi:hypothetical protein
MMSFTNRRLSPIACLIFLNGLLLTGLSILPDTMTPAKALAAKSSPMIYALVDVGKRTKAMPHEKYRQGERELFIKEGLAWHGVYESPASKLPIVRAQKDMCAWLNENLHVEYVGKTDILRIWLKAGSSEEQAEIVNAIVRFYFRFVVDSYRKFLKDNIALSQRILADIAQVLPREEAELIRLDKAVPADGIEQENLWIQRNRQARSLGALKKGATAIRATIEQDEASLRTLPRVIKWAGQPSSAE